MPNFSLFYNAIIITLPVSFLNVFMKENTSDIGKRLQKHRI